MQLNPSFLFLRPLLMLYFVFEVDIYVHFYKQPLPLVALLQQAKISSTKSYSTQQEQVWNTKRRILCLMGTTQGLLFFQRWVHTPHKLRSLSRLCTDSFNCQTLLTACQQRKCHKFIVQTFSQKSTIPFPFAPSKLPPVSVDQRIYLFQVFLYVISNLYIYNYNYSVCGSFFAFKPPSSSAADT